MQRDFVGWSGNEQMRAGTTVLLNGLTAAVADVALNDLSRARDFAGMRRYFLRHGILQAASYAALTVMIGAAAVVATTRVLFGYAAPRTWAEVLQTLSTCFVVGWAMDVAIRRMGVFPELRDYYARHGAGLWGALSLVVSMGVALSIQAFVLPHLL